MSEGEQSVPYQPPVHRPPSANLEAQQPDWSYPSNGTAPVANAAEDYEGSNFLSLILITIKIIYKVELAFLFIPALYQFDLRYFVLRGGGQLLEILDRISRLTNKFIGYIRGRKNTKALLCRKFKLQCL